MGYFYRILLLKIYVELKNQDEVAIKYSKYSETGCLITI